MRLTALDRMLLSYCFREIHNEFKSGNRIDVPVPCQNIADFERWRINMVDKLLADPDYDDKEDPFENLTEVQKIVDAENFQGVLDSLNEEEKVKEQIRKRVSIWGE